jgi:hypothetical protein
MSKYDWEAIEREYRAGQFSIREISRKHGAPESSIRAYAKKYGWKRDLTKKVQQRVRAELHHGDAGKDDLLSASDEEIVSEAAARGVEVVRQHRKILQDLHEIRNDIQDKLKGYIKENKAEGYTIQLFDKKTGEWKEKVMLSFLGDRESVGDLLQKLCTVTEKIIKLERQAFSVDEAERKAELMVIELDSCPSSNLSETPEE